MNAQESVTYFIEWQVAAYINDGKLQMASRMSTIAEALHRGETVWAVILCSQAADEGFLPPSFVERMRAVFKVGRIS